jgi:carbon-monoxide dehydrogenase iron sulfur subunit
VDCWICSTVCTRFSSLYRLILAEGCWSSSMSCNYGVIGRQIKAGVKCDLCEGRELPACVEACPTHALIYLEVEGR